jgi:hypothetical protein
MRNVVSGPEPARIGGGAEGLGPAAPEARADETSCNLKDFEEHTMT